RIHSSLSHLLLSLFSSLLPPPPRSTLFPYTTLFRSACQDGRQLVARRAQLGLRGLRRGTRAFLPAGLGTGFLCLLPLGQVARKRSEEHTSELQSLRHLVCRLLLEKKKQKNRITSTVP